MLNLTQLKARLERLPRARMEIRFSSTYAEYTAKAKNCRLDLQQVLVSSKYISGLFSNPRCENAVADEINACRRICASLKKEFEANPENVLNRSTEGKFTNLKDHTQKAVGFCQTYWSQEISQNVLRWDKLIGVVSRLGPKGANELKQVIDRLKTYHVPKTQRDETQVRSWIAILQKGIANFGLKGPFGDFLRASVEEGATPRGLLEEEIAKKLDEYRLWDSFKVKLI